MVVPDAQRALSAFVARLRAHSPLDEGDCRALIALPLREMVVPARQPLVRPTQKSSQAWLVVEGLVGRISQTNDGLRQIQALSVPGEIANVAAMMLPARLCGFEALTKSRVIGISHDALRGLAADHPAVAAALMREALLVKEVLAQWLLNIGRREARAKVTHFLCEMAVRHHATNRGGGAEFVLPMTQEQLGEALALTSVHINRTLKALREDRLVEIVRHEVRIHDWTAVVAAAEFDSAYLRLADPAEELEQSPVGRAIAPARQLARFGAD